MFEFGSDGILLRKINKLGKINIYGRVTTTSSPFVLRRCDGWGVSHSSPLRALYKALAN